MRRSTVSLTLLVCLGLLVALGTASAQLAPTRKAPRNVPLETYDNPPAPLRKIETSPRMISQFGVFTSYQVNVDANGQNIIGDAANECSISVDPTDGNKRTIAWRQFNDVTSNFRQGGWGYTTDAGLTWTFPGVLHDNVFRSDPVTQSDAEGSFFYLSLRSDGFSFFCERSSNATIGGQTPTFDQVTPVDFGGELAFGGINLAALTGMLFLAVDRSGGPTNNHIYMLASVVPPGRSTTDVMFVRSTDGGLTFSAPVKVNDDPVNPSKWHWFGMFAVAPNGRLDAVWYDTRNAANKTDSQLFYSWSTDGGVTWAPNVAVSDSFNPFEGYPNQSKIGDYITIVSDNGGGNVAYSATFNFNSSRGQHEEDVYYVRVAPSTTGINLVSAASRLTHGAAGTFDVSMPLTGVSGVEDRSATPYNAVFTFDAPVTSGEVTVIGGTATVGAITFSGNSMTAQLTGVTSAEIVTLHTQNINGDGQPHGDVPFGFLTADVNANRIVDRPDQQQIQANRGQPATA